MLGLLFRRVGWWALVAMAAVALWRGMPNTPAGLYAWGEEQSGKAQAFITNLVDQVRGGADGAQQGSAEPGSGAGGAGAGDTGQAGTGGAGLPTTEPAAAKKALAALPVTPEPAVAYDRSDWPHWDADGCWNIRETVLARSAKPGTLRLADADGNPTSDRGRACSVAAGTWIDAYTGEKITDPSSLDVDHMVPLSEAASSGGQAWPNDRKKQYANNLNAGHLVAVSAAANRSKGDKDPAAWRPPDRTAWCGYAGTWIAVKSSWGLTVDAAEQVALRDMLATC